MKVFHLLCFCYILGVATLQLNRKPVNGLNLELLTDLNIALEKLESQKTCKGIILTSVGSGLILGLRPANERRRYKVTPSLIGWAQT